MKEYEQKKLLLSFNMLVGKANNYDYIADFLTTDERVKKYYSEVVGDSSNKIIMSPDIVVQTINYILNELEDKIK